MTPPQKDAETIAWLLGLIALGLGAGLQWGWPASLIALGVVFTVWPLVKEVLRSRP